MNLTIEFVIYPGTLGLDITGPLEVFHTASSVVSNKSYEKQGYRTRFVAVEKGPIRLSSGLEIVADGSFDEKEHADILLIPGGTNIDNVINNQEFMNYIRERSKKVTRIISVCKGAFILAAAGLLEGKEATTHWMSVGQLTQAYPGVKVKPDAIYTHDGNIYTSAGVTAGIDLALAVVEEDFGESVAMNVSKILVLYYRRPGSQSQFSAWLKAQEAAGKSFSKLHHWLVRNLDKRITVEQMAEYTIMSDRNFVRVFKQKTGMTPTKYLEILRLDRAREIMAAGDESLERIAIMCGFGLEERLRRAFLRHFGETPSQYRLQTKKT